jgi:hypothetical protein
VVLVEAFRMGFSVVRGVAGAFILLYIVPQVQTVEMARRTNLELTIPGSRSKFTKTDHTQTTPTMLSLLLPMTAEATLSPAVPVSLSQPYVGADGGFGSWSMLSPTFSNASLLAPALSAWSVRVNDYEYSMSVTAMVRVDDVPVTTGTLAAFVDGEVRGMGGSKLVPFGPHVGQSLFMLLVYSDDVSMSEVVSFRYTAAELPLQDRRDSAGLYFHALTLKLEPGLVSQLGETEVFVKDNFVGDAVHPRVYSGLSSPSCPALPPVVPLHPRSRNCAAQR